MVKNRNDLRAGLFIIASVLAVAAVAAMIRGLDVLTTPTDMRNVRFELTDDVGGLRVGDDVRVGGFKVGQVHSITLESSSQAGGTPFIHVIYDFPRKYVLHQDAVVRIQGSAIGTVSWLNFESLGSGPLLAREDQNFHGYRSSFSQIVSELADLRNPIKQTLGNLRDIAQDVHDKTLPQLDSAVTDARDVVGHVRAQVDPAFAKYHALVDHAVITVDKIGDFFGSTASDFRATMAHLAEIAKAIHEKLPEMLDRFDAILAKVDQSVQSAQTALEDIKATVVNTREITASAKSIVVGNRGKFDAMIASAKLAADNLKNAAAEIRRSPWRLFYKPAAGELGNLNLYDAARQFADGAGELNDAATALRDALQDKNADPQQLQKLLDKLDNSFNNFNQVEKTLWEDVKE
jgi:ABC-type transporter Mla subunit MlaD